MDGFKSSPKMQCFKEGGAVKYKSRHSEKSEMSEDTAKDKKVVKKAFAMHDKQSHEGEKTDLKKLNKGGRMKKDSGCVGRYQAGGSLKPVDAEKNPGLAELPTNVRNKMGYVKKGGKVKKYADGRMVGQGAISDTERMRLANRAKNRAMLSPMQQQELDAQEAAAAAAAQKGGMGGMGSGLNSLINRKKGGKAKAC